ncbi:OmpA family protein [Pontibacter actiniarum]|uniref:OmpA-like domain-containing protein n=1 Tax=Pontibacter actiniarum TaxID=323450 RepID=A0A1X9YT96_9BACT|nr:OmpA family protein [Pontibacter actiniarum]ARS36099.1 hypothetical protein CA264_12025 [Pontibacter actiniarum]
MKRAIYTITLLLAAASAQAQTPIKQAREEIADVTLLGEHLLIYTKKEDQGQYLYREEKGSGHAEKDPQLNAGTVNTAVGTNAAGNELYVYQQSGRRSGRIAVYRLENGAFTKTEERKAPRFLNHSPNLGMHLSEDRKRLLITAELAKSEGYDDLYLSEWQNGRWSKPKNLGKEVNSRAAEFAPYVSGDSLFFSRKQGEAAYVYTVPLREGGTPAGEPVKLKGQVNREGAFNAYYKKAGEQELWVSAAADSYVAYLTEKEAPKAEPSEEPAAETVAAAGPAVASGTATAAGPVSEDAVLQLTYGFNQVYMNEESEKQLRSFLEALPNGAAIFVEGFSDAQGPEAGKVSVSRQRAAFVKWYILNKFNHKSFKTKTGSEVLQQVGEQARRVELKVQ